MKSFFKIVFASMVGYIFTALLLCILGLIMLFSAMATESSVEKVKPNTMMEIVFSGVVSDRAANNPFANISNFTGTIEKSMGMDHLLTAIHNAKEDKKIKGIYLHFGDFAIGLGHAKELRDALEDFKTSGKFIYSYGEYYSQTAYYLGSISDKIYIHPMGVVDFKGIDMQTVLFKKMLDKLGVEIQVVRHGKFKSAVEPFTEEKISPANREQLTLIAHSLWNTVLTDISRTRNISVSQLNQIADSLDGMFPEKAFEKGLVDSLYTREQMLTRLMEEMSVKKEKDLHKMGYVKYAEASKKEESVKDRVAIIYAQGEIGTNKGNDTEIGTKNITDAIRKAAKDDKVKAIVLRVNSPGGSVLTSELIYNEVLLAKEKKPIIASFSDVAASGGYYISCACNKILAEPTTITGSIGVFGVVPNAQKLLTDKIGLSFDEVKTNANTGIGSRIRPMTAYEIKVMQKNIEQVYTDFITRVANGRNMTAAQVDSIGQGRVWTGLDAKKIGLVDTLGGLKDAIAQAAQIAGIEKYKIVEYPKQKELLEQLNDLLDNSSSEAIKAELGEYAYLYDAVQQIKNYNGVQARIPYILKIQ